MKMTGALNYLSLTPCFSGVGDVNKRETVKTVSHSCLIAITPLKQGVNERIRFASFRLCVIALKCSLLLALLFFTGCASTPTHHVPLTGDIMVDGPRMIAGGPPRDKVLWQYRTAAAAMRHGQFDVAKPMLDDALLTLGGLYGKDAEGRKSRRMFQQIGRASCRERV